MRWIQVDLTVTCRSCGTSGLGWLKSKNGKWYLAQTRRFADGRIEAGTAAFHDCPNRTGRGRASQAWPSPPPPNFAFDPMLEQILESGYKAVARKVHPDIGGSTKEMQKLNGMMTTLRNILRFALGRRTN